MARGLHRPRQVISILPTPPEFPLGRRAERPVQFDVGGETAREIYGWNLPGVLVRRDTVLTSWDAAPTLAALLEVECPAPPLSAPVPLPGLAEYTERIKDRLRPHQRDGIRFLVRRAWAYCADDMRTGKSLTALAAARLAGSKHALIITTANAKPGWTREIIRWYGVVPVVLEGRAGASAREVCVACRGRGVVLRDDAPTPCGECGGKGNALVSVKPAGKQLEPEIFETGDATVWPPRYRGCRKHKDKIQNTATECAACRALLTQTVREAPFVVVNYDIINGQRERDAEGGLVRRTDLPGWTSLLMSGHFDTVLLDEAHVLRSIDYKSIQKTRKARSERIYDAVIDVPRVWALSGTPSCGFVRDLWPQYNIISKGLFGQDPFSYGKRYCLPAEAPIWMADLTFKPISEVRVGDVVMGWRGASSKGRRKFGPTVVRAVHKRRAEVNKVGLASGRFVRCTPDHVWASGRRWAGVAGAEQWVNAVLPSDVSVRKKDGTFNKGSSRWGACLARVIDPVSPGVTTGRDYARGYVHGALDGDGTVRDCWYLRAGRDVAERVTSISLRVTDAEFAQRYHEMLTRLRIRHTNDFSSFKYLRTVNSGKSSVSLYYLPRDGNDDYWRGYLAGVYDAEGWGMTIAQYQNRNPAVYDTICHALRRFSFSVHEAPEVIRFRGGREEFVRFWSLVRPACSVKRVGINQNHTKVEGVCSKWTGDDVVSVEPQGEEDVWCLTTDSHNYVAYGYASHNCDAHSGDYGWDDSGHGYLADVELPQRQAVFVIRRTMAEVAPHMPAITHQLVELEMSDADGRELRDGRNWALEGKKAVESEVRRLSAVKHDAVAEAMCDEMANGHKTFALTYHVEDARRLAKVIAKLMESNQYRVLSRKHNAKLWVIAGGERSSGGTTDGACMEFVEHAGAALMVATTKSLQGGVSLKGAVSCHHVDFSDDPTEMAQAQRRPFEMDAGLTGYTCVYYVVRGTVDDRLERIILPKLETMSVLAPTAENSTIRSALARETDFSAWDAAWDAIGQSAAGRDDVAGIAEDTE